MLPPAPIVSPASGDVPPPGPPPSSPTSSPLDIVDEITAWLNEFKPKDGHRPNQPGTPAESSSSATTSQSIDRSHVSSTPKQLPHWYYMGSAAAGRPQPAKRSTNTSSSSSPKTIPPSPLNKAPFRDLSMDADAENRQIVENEIQLAREDERLREFNTTLRQQHSYEVRRQRMRQQQQQQQQQQPKAAAGGAAGAPWLASRFENLSISPTGQHSQTPSPPSADRIESIEDDDEMFARTVYRTGRGISTGQSFPPPSSFPASFLAASSSYISSSLQSGALTPTMRQEIRMQRKYQQPWRRSKAHPAALRAHANAKRQLQMASVLQASPSVGGLDNMASGKRDPTGSSGPSGSGSEITASTTATKTSPSSSLERREIVLPHDILSHIFSYFDSRANAQQYYDKTVPSDLVACSRVNMAWRIAALEKVWQTILLPDPMDPSCRKLLYLLASSHSAAKVLERSYNLTDLIQRVEIDLIQAVSVITTAGSVPADFSVTALASMQGPFMGGDPRPFSRTIHALVRLVAPFRTLSIQLPQEIDMSEAECLTKTWSVPILSAVVDAVGDAKIQELDMPSAMYCTVKTFPGMLSLISALKDLRTLILGYSSRDWPLLRAILSLPLLENLCIFDSCWSNQIWIYLLGTLGSRLRGLSIVQGRRPLEGAVLREGIAPFCRQLTTLSIPFIQLFQGLSPVLVDEDLVPVIKACHGLQVVNLSGQLLLGDGTLEALAELWGLEWLDIRNCQEMTGKTVKRLRWQSIQKVRVFGCDSLTTDFLNLVAMVWQSQRVAIGQSPSSAAPGGAQGSTENNAAALTLSTTSSAAAATTTHNHANDSTRKTATATRASASAPLLPPSATTALHRASTPVLGTPADYYSPMLGSPHMTGSGVGSGRSTPSPVPGMKLNNGSNSGSGGGGGHPTKSNTTPAYVGLAVLDFKTDLEDPVEMGWVRQREDEPPLDVDEDHFFAEWYR
ncbi:hypothetical protein BGZ73_003455 [Actinomortierella ambigua]|nr:hypothetical protein BGZ73_003455 [Actinomortierella ambigua]